MTIEKASSSAFRPDCQIGQILRSGAIDKGSSSFGFVVEQVRSFS